MSPPGEGTAAGPDRPGRRRRRLLAGLAVLAVLALAVGAAGLDEVRLSSAGGGADADQPVEVGDTSRAAGEENDGSARVSPWYLLVVYVVGALATLGLAWRRDVQTVWLVMAAMVLLFVALALVASTGGSPFAEPSNGSQVTEPPNETQLGSGTGSEANSAPTATALPTGALLLVGVVLGVGAVLGFSRAATPGADDEDGGDETAATDAGDPDAAAIAAAAGRAADSLAGAEDLDNPVYRAWRDMTTVLEAEPDPTLTPAEFRDRALAAGLPPDPVDTLTEVFRDVRYGNLAVTSDRQAAALGALREVERAAERVAEEESGGPGRMSGAGDDGGSAAGDAGTGQFDQGRDDDVGTTDAGEGATEADEGTTDVADGTDDASDSSADASDRDRGGGEP